jgi:crotonobetainyl-CoA:carnitine CoA-transferase CaiB-like acyl-CoA transferase
MAQRDIAFAPVKSLREALDDPQVRARGMVLVDEHGWEHLGTPIRFVDEPGRVGSRLPALGEHSAEVLREVGYGEAELAAMKATGVF